MNIITTILTNLDSQIKNLVSEYAKSYKKITGKDMTENNLKYTELEITHDLVKSVEKYTSNTDNLVSVSSQVSAKGNLEINAVIERNNVNYSLSTEVIYAGGHNIQILHYRYITKTNLPKTGSSIVTESIKSQIKKMDKISKLLDENSKYLKKVKELELEVSRKILFNNQDIINEYLSEKSEGHSSYITDTFEQNKSKYPNSTWEKDEYLEFQKKSINNIITHFNQILIIEKNHIKSYYKMISKNEALLLNL